MALIALAAAPLAALMTQVDQFQQRAGDGWAAELAQATISARSACCRLSNEASRCQ